MDSTKVSRRWRWVQVTALILLALSGTAAAEGIRDRTAWGVLVPRSRPVDSVWWQGRVVVADDGGGLLLFDVDAGSVETWTTRDGLTTNLLTSVDADTTGRLWVGTRGGGVVRYDASGTARSITGLLESAVTDLAADGDLVYYGTLSGAGRIAGGFPEQVFQAGDGMPSDEVRSVAAYAGVAWFGTPAGVGQFDRETNLVTVRNSGLGPNLEVLDLRAGELGVFVTTADGVYRWEATQWVALTAPPSLARRLVLLGDGLLAIGAGGTAWDYDFGAGTWTARSLDTTGHQYSSLDNAGRTQYPGALRTADGSVLFVATRLNPALIRSDPLTTLWSEDLTQWPTARGLFGSNVRGLAGDGRGGAWLGAFPVYDGVTHWRADGSVVAYALRDDDPGDAEDLGWMQAAKIAALADSRGDVWVSTFSVGVTRLRPSVDEDAASSGYLHFRPEDSPLNSRRVLAIAEDPKGRVWFASDGQLAGGDLELNTGLDILVDPSNPEAASSWLKVTPDNSQLGGPGLTSISFRGTNEVWLSVNGVGVQRWLYDADPSDMDIELSALEDFLAWKTFDRLPVTSSGTELAAPRGVQFTADGRVWLATNDAGVFRFDPDSNLLPSDVDQIRVSAFGVSLLSNQVRSIALEGSGALWVATDAGLDRVSETSDGYRVDSFTDLPTYESRDLGQSYLPDILSPLPSSNVNTLKIDRERGLLFVATQNGAARIDLGRLAIAAPTEFSFGIYPNPVRSGDAGVVVDDFDGEAVVTVYNLLGVRILERTGVRAGDQVWDGRNRLGDYVASGMYVIRVATAAGSTQRTVAIER